MFHSYRDMIRAPKEPEKPSTIEVYQCDMCEKGGWQSENEVEFHRKIAHYRILHGFMSTFRNKFCTICMTVQDSHVDLIRHIKTQHLLSSPNAKRVERQIYICNVCTHIFFNKDILAIHILYIHQKRKCDRRNTQFTCPKCFKSIQLASIWSHFQKHDIPSVSLCNICLTNFPNRADLYKHVKTHNGYYMCEPCGYNSTKRITYKTHLKKHITTPVPPGTVTPEVMSTVFKKHKTNIPRYNLQNALRGLNLPNFIEICTLCREICLNKTEIKIHILRDHMSDEIVKKRHLCMCGKEFPYSIVLKQHVLKNKFEGLHEAVDSSETTFGYITEAKIHKTPQRQYSKKAVKSLKAFSDGETPEITADPTDTDCNGTNIPDGIETVKILNLETQDMHIELSNNTEKSEQKKDPSEETTFKDDEKMALAVSVANALLHSISTSQ